MAITKISWGLSGNSKVSGTSLSVATVITTVATPQVGDLLVIGFVADNLSASTPTISSVTINTAGAISSTNKVSAFCSDASATAAADVIIGYFIAEVTTAFTSSTTITVTLSGTVTAKAAVAYALTGGANWAGYNIGTVQAPTAGTTGTLSTTRAASAPNGTVIVVGGSQSSTAPLQNGTSFNSDATTGGAAATNVAVSLGDDDSSTSSDGFSSAPDGGWLILGIINAATIPIQLSRRMVRATVRRRPGTPSPVPPQVAASANPVLVPSPVRSKTHGLILRRHRIVEVVPPQVAAPAAPRFLQDPPRRVLRSLLVRRGHVSTINAPVDVPMPTKARRKVVLPLRRVGRATPVNMQEMPQTLNFHRRRFTWKPRPNVPTVVPTQVVAPPPPLLPLWLFRVRRTVIGLRRGHVVTSVPPQQVAVQPPPYVAQLKTQRRVQTAPRHSRSTAPLSQVEPVSVIPNRRRFVPLVRHRSVTAPPILQIEPPRQITGRHRFNPPAPRHRLVITAPIPQIEPPRQASRRRLGVVIKHRQISIPVPAPVANVVSTIVRLALAPSGGSMSATPSAGSSASGGPIGGSSSSAAPSSGASSAGQAGPDTTANIDPLL